MRPQLRIRLRDLEWRQRYLNKHYMVYGPIDMDCATALRVLKCRPRPGDKVSYFATARSGQKPWLGGQLNTITDEEWETMKDYPRCEVQKN